MQTTKGRALDITFDGAHLVDGEPISYDYPLYAAHGVEAPLGTGKVSFTRGTDTVDVDFNIDPDKELLPMRVIG